MFLAWACLAHAAHGAVRAHPVIAGSSTLFPLGVAVAERAAGPGPLVVPMGTGAGIAWFCEGLGPATPDIALASRAMTPEERQACRNAGVAPLEQIELGRDGIVLIADPGLGLPGLTSDELWRALALRVPDPAGGAPWIANPYRTWRELSPRLPDLPIQVFGPPATSGTRDAFVALALLPACEAALRDHPGFAAERQACGQLRRDGAWVDAGENDDALVARLGANPRALGVAGHGAALRHPGRVAALCIDGVCPDAGTIASGAYPWSRALFLYSKPAHREFVPSLEGLIEGFLSRDALEPGGYLARAGLVPVSPRRVLLEEGAPGEMRGASAWAFRLATIALVVVLAAIVAGVALVRRPRPVARRLERVVVGALAAGALVSGTLLAVVLATLLVPAVNFFMQVPVIDFLAGRHWSPETAIRATQVVGEGAFGILPVLLGSALVALVALLLALPLALAAALHAFAWAGERFRRAWRPGIRLAALVPTVVYGLFAALTVGPAVAAAAAWFGASAAVQSTLAAGLVVGIMIAPVLAAHIGEVLEAVPSAAAESAIGLGATRWETLRDIVLPDAAAGIGAALLFSVTRALGETVIVLMAAGLAATWSLDLLGTTTTLTVQIVALMSGTHELDHIRTQLPFVLGLFLAIIVLPLNGWALRLSRRSHVAPSPVI